MEKFYQLGLINESACNWEEAIKSYSSCLNMGPDHLQARIHLGQIYIQINNLDEALIQINKALELNPKEEEALVALAWIYLLENKMNPAEKIFIEALRENPDNLKANLGMGWIYLRNEESIKAESYLKKYNNDINANDIYLKAHLELIGKYYFNKGKYDLAEFWYEKITQLEPNNFNSLRRLIMSCFFQKKYEKASTWIKKTKNFDLKAVNLNLENFIEALESCCQEKYDKAVDFLINMSNINSEELPDYYLFLGKFYLAKGDLKLAEEAFSKSLQALPDFIHSKIALEEISGKI